MENGTGSWIDLPLVSFYYLTIPLVTGLIVSRHKPFGIGSVQNTPPVETDGAHVRNGVPTKKVTKTSEIHESFAFCP